MEEYIPLRTSSNSWSCVLNKMAAAIKQENIKMDNTGVTLQNLKEKTFVFAKKAFAMAVDNKIPRTQNTLLDENLMIKLGIKPTRVMSQRFAYAGISTRIVAEARFTTQTVLKGVPTGNTFLKGTHHHLVPVPLLPARQPAGEPELSQRTTMNCVNTLMRMTLMTTSSVLLRMSLVMKELKGL